MDAHLLKHGTKAAKLPPGAIIGAAPADLERRKHNTNTELSPPYHRYAFLRRHVIDAETPEQIIAAAINELALGAASSKVQTQFLYSDPEALYEALGRLRGTCSPS